MQDLILVSIVVIYVIKVILSHNLFISKVIIKIKFLGIHIEINGKEKKHSPSEK